MRRRPQQASATRSRSPASRRRSVGPGARWRGCAKRDRLTKARQVLRPRDRAVPAARRRRTRPDKLYLKLSHFYRADCVYDLGKYEEAIKLYDAAAFRYQDDPSALAAYVQIVNAYCALGKPTRRRPRTSGPSGCCGGCRPRLRATAASSMPKEYWDKWLKWTSAAGMW